MNDFLISVIVSTYNRPDALRVVLDGLLRQTDRHYEIIVADDGSKAPTRALVEEFAAKSPVPLHHVWHPDDGFRLSAIRNKGILQAKGSYLIFLDGDCVPQADFVARHRMLAQPGMMMTGSRILLGEQLTAQVVNGLPILDQGPAFWLAQRARGEANKILPLFFRLPDMPQRQVPGFKWRGIKGCNLAAWRSDIEMVNGFDETFTGWGHEDADFVARLHNAGVRRKKGFWSTEVLHLWHREAKRDQESPNRQKVLRRIESREMRAERGLGESSLATN
ncbi:MAG TPA: glycosyltransferase family 2 protein [Noviherbaspirillum sp.]|uniref:glycosyltransferase family 2 protein n=1 Tax=Noviherbaspirillum sp. TaxID=1926288 RepID=UPI002B460A2D|nr:glycosyltransferase family 2 protein [Noviherbaspirillum sp.]HJV84331.1 glycosyltransferase family 2 protein [Noviherbaspirillum sp.]